MSLAAVPLEWEARSEPQSELVSNRRSRYCWVPFLMPLALSAVSWMAGGSPMFTDAAWLCITTICIVYVIRELALFPQRWGIGGLILYGGTAIWFCYDYIVHWLGISF